MSSDSTDRSDRLPGPESTSRRAGREGGIVPDADLVRYMDGQLGAAERAALRLRIDASPEAVDRLQTLRRRSSALSRLLSHTYPAGSRIEHAAAAIRERLSDEAPQAMPATDIHSFSPVREGNRVPGGGRVRRPGVHRAAAMVTLLLVAGAVAVSPVRAWVGDRIRYVAEAIGVTGATIDPLQPGSPAAAGADLAVTFSVSGETFEIRVPRPAGVLVIRRGAAATGSAEAESGAEADLLGGATFVVFPDGIRIEAAAPDAVYRVTLPAAIRSVRVHAGDAEPTVHRLPGGQGVLRIDLGGLEG